MHHFEINFVLNDFKAQGSNLPLLYQLQGNSSTIKSVLFHGTVPRLVKEERIRVFYGFFWSGIYSNGGLLWPFKITTGESF
ncbi:MAG: hypothetical protein ACI9FJ_001009 [Alteromonadaceae bacterium]|jgi:hypothetical protein